jgi:hypothetical protein
MTRKEGVYLGDGVYASWDGYHIWLTTERDHGWERIALDSQVFSALTEYAKGKHIDP